MIPKTIMIEAVMLSQLPVQDLNSEIVTRSKKKRLSVPILRQKSRYR